MSRIVYLANSFPEAGEPYVWEEIRELRRQGQEVLCCSFRRPSKIPPELAAFSAETLYIPQWPSSLAAAIVLIARLGAIRDFVWRIIRGPEAVLRRVRALAHTWLGLCLAARLRNREISHIHVHHGYFAAWAGMVAARLLKARFSMTLHGSDLLVRADYLDYKLRECRSCVTVSEFNRNYTLRKYPEIDTSKILVHRLGVDVEFWRPIAKRSGDETFRIVSVGRLHPVKNHDFLIRACGALKRAGVDFKCVIAGEGSEHARLQKLIVDLDLVTHVELRGHIRRERLPELYGEADAVVFTSRSEGIPIAAMEAMAMGKIVLAPAITGIPELIVNGKTGFLYRPNSIQDFLAKLLQIRGELSSLTGLGEAARRHIESQFHRERNLKDFSADFLRRTLSTGTTRELYDANPLLQQI